MTFRDLWQDLPESIKQLLDALSIATLLGSLISMLPAIASLLTIMWTVIRIYETPTVQALFRRNRKLESRDEQ